MDSTLSDVLNHFLSIFMKLIEVKLEAKPKSLQPIPLVIFPEHFLSMNTHFPQKHSLTVAIAMNHKGTDFLPHT